MGRGGWDKQAHNLPLLRHTYATLQLALGTDIYTLSKMLGHAHVATTAIYTDVINDKKREAANRISLR